MNTRNRLRNAAFLLICGLIAFTTAAAAQKRDNPLEQFDWLVNGKWTHENTVQEFEWGFDKKSIVARSYLVAENDKTLVSEGVWFWHPGEKVIMGYFSAKGMPFSFIESVAEFDGKKLIHRLKTYSDSDEGQDYVEVIEPMSGDSYAWKLYYGVDTSARAIMSGTYKKK